MKFLTYFKIVASFESRAVLSVLLLDVLVSNSFLTNDAIESKMINFTPLVIMSSSKFSNLKRKSKLFFIKFGTRFSIASFERNTSAIY